MGVFGGLGMRRFVLVSIVFVQMIFRQSAVAATYNINLSTVGGGISTPGSYCYGSYCFGGGVETKLFTFSEPSTVNFGTLTLDGFVFNDGGYALGTPIIAAYIGELVVSYTPLYFGYNPGLQTVQYCIQPRGGTCAVIPTPAPIVENLVFDDVTQIQFAWTGPFTYVAPVPEPSTWAMLLIGFAGIGFAGYRKSRPEKLI
jgi:PEP-CTERM motif